MAPLQGLSVQGLGSPEQQQAVHQAVEGEPGHQQAPPPGVHSVTREAVYKGRQGGVGANHASEDYYLATHFYTFMFHLLLKLYLFLAGVDIAGEGHDNEGDPRQQPAHIKEHEAS